MNRTENLRKLSSSGFDLVVIGGGITGACLAYDAAKRGLKVALLEKGDFGAATSSASSRVLHGGIRYLQQLQIGKVRESAFERVYFQNLVPHLCRYVPFLIPTFRQLSKGRLALRLALWAYAIASFGQNRAARSEHSRVPPTRMIGKDALWAELPFLRGNSAITGAAVLPECHMHSSERVTLALIQGAAEHGAVISNYAQAIEMQVGEDGEKRISVRNLLDDTVISLRGSVVANCAGPWIGPVNNALLGKSIGPVTGFSRGAHVIVSGLDLQSAVALPTTQQIEGFTDRGGRHMFIIPWRGRALIGTSYAAHPETLDSVIPTDSDIDQLVDGINDAVGCDLVTSENVVYSFAGIYPLTTENVDASKYQGTGEYEIIDHGKSGGIDGYFSIFGAKYTTARLLAEKACDRIVRKLPGSYRPCDTRQEPVPCGDFGELEQFVAELRDAYVSVAEAETIDNLVTNFGRDARHVLDMVVEHPELGEALADDRGMIAAEAVYSARAEMVCRLKDFVFRRSGLGTIGDPGEAVIRRCADLVGDELGWSDSRRLEECDAVHQVFRAEAVAGARSIPVG